MLESALKNNYFKFNGEDKQQLSGMALLVQHLHQYIPVYLWIKQTGFLVSQKNPKPLVWFCNIDDIIFFVLMEYKRKIYTFKLKIYT